MCRRVPRRVPVQVLPSPLVRDQVPCGLIQARGVVLKWSFF